jgi:hypothetical protein
MDNLVINQINGTTTFTIKHIDRESTSNIVTSVLTLTGTWSLVDRTRQTLSCLIISDSPLTSFTFIKYSYETSKLSIYIQIPPAKVPSSLTSSMIVGENCNLISSGDIIYNLTTLKMVSPSGWNIMAQSASLLYVIADYKLY